MTVSRLLDFLVLGILVAVELLIAWPDSTQRHGAFPAARAYRAQMRKERA